MQLPIDLREDQSKSFICTVSLCGDFGDETIRFYEDVESAREAKQFMDVHGCGGYCIKDHYIVRIPRGHLKNMKKRTYFKRSSYLRWLVYDKIVWEL
jgi:hypothetical protein